VYEGDPNGSNLSLCTRDSALGSGDTAAITKRLNVGCGASKVPVEWRNVSNFTVWCNSTTVYNSEALAKFNTRPELP